MKDCRINALNWEADPRKRNHQENITFGKLLSKYREIRGNDITIGEGRLQFASKAG